MLEAALAGCRLLLSDIAPYREMVREGLAADLLAEPVSRSLAEALRQVQRGGEHPAERTPLSAPPAGGTAR